MNEVIYLSIELGGINGSYDMSFSKTVTMGDILTIGLIIVTLLTALIAYFKFKFDKEYKYIERIRQEYMNLFDFNTVKLYKDVWKWSTVVPPTIRLKFTSQDHEEWGDFKHIINCQFKHYKYREGWGLYKKAEKAVNKFNKFVESTHKKLTARIDPILEEINLEVWCGGSMGRPKEHINGSKVIASDIINTMIICNEETWSYGIYVRLPAASDEAFALKGPGTFIGQAESREELDKMMDLLQQIVDDDEIIKIAKKIIKANEKVEETVENYNNILSNILKDIKMYPRAGVWR
jgi:hypothetical protein